VFPQRRLDLVWRLLLGLGAVPGIAMIYARCTMKETEQFVKRSTPRNLTVIGDSAGNDWTTSTSSPDESPAPEQLPLRAVLAARARMVKQYWCVVIRRRGLAFVICAACGIGRFSTVMALLFVLRIFQAAVGRNGWHVASLRHRVLR
jgi:ribosomal protein L36